jgi:hypothetical protein
MSKPGITIKGADRLIKKLKALGSEKTARRIMRRVTNAATTPLLQAVRAEIPVDEGSLKKSIAKKVIGRRMRYNGIVGSDISRLDEDGKEIAARHLHLVEEGFEAVNGKVIPGQFPLRRGQENAKARVASVYESKLADEIDKEAAKGGA